MLESQLKVFYSRLIKILKLYWWMMALTDESGKICDTLARSDNRVTVIHKKNGGLSDARNAGLDRATGELIGFVDSDDYIEKKYV